MSYYDPEELEREFGELRKKDRKVTLLLFIAIITVSFTGYIAVDLYKQITQPTLNASSGGGCGSTLLLP